MYYIYFPLKDRTGVFRIGVGVSSNPAGPFKPEPQPMEGSFSIDQAMFEDEDGEHYMYWGGIWGGQLQRWVTGEYDPDAPEEQEGDAPAIGPRIAQMADNMLEFAETPREIVILDENGDPIKQSDKERRFFESPWVHKYQRSEEHTSELQSRGHLVCRLLLEKKNDN